MDEIEQINKIEKITDGNEQIYNLIVYSKIFHLVFKSGIKVDKMI